MIFNSRDEFRGRPLPGPGQEKYLDIDRSGHQKSEAGKPEGVKKLQTAVMASCEALGQGPEEAAKVLRYLENEWISDMAALNRLSQDGWREIRLPLGLKEELRRRLDDSNAKASAADLSKLKTSAAPSAGSRMQDVVKRVLPSSRTRQNFDPADEVLDMMQQEFRRRGGGTLKGLARRFSIMDDNGSKNVDRGEFHKALVELNLGLTEDDIALLWSLVDKDSSGLASFDELVSLIGGRLSHRRRRAVQMAFDHLDLSRNGKLDLEDLKLAYDPTVIAESSRNLLGKMMPADAVMEDFLENFRKLVGGQVKGEISYPDFEKYYEMISASIDTDDYFEEMVRLAWGLPENWLKGAGGIMQYPGIGRRDSAGMAGSPRANSRGRPGSAHYHQHHQTSLGGSLGAHAAQRSLNGPKRNGEQLLRKLSTAIAHGSRGNAANLYGDAVVKCHHPNAISKWKKAANAVMGGAGAGAQSDTGPPALVPRSEFENVVLQILPTMDSQDIATLATVFQDHAKKDHIDHRSFLKRLRAEVPSRHEIAVRIFKQLAGESDELDLTKLSKVPPGARLALGDQEKVSLRSWLDFHETVAIASAENSDAVYEAQLRHLWGLRDGRGQVPERPFPGYYRGMSRIQLG
eukprot:CAMPEP_0197637902 /NCGR_PEP_ID=MMETSP1338-20131121/12986_1 /TAXON_ID=43686 ORGANISM="Pelagodinium beii, Strain RCC1491" /NCGR_SAMPLE_ID=MMETSP1338 /ASSEMBLY_ACC=CAM_ASM_000754 /LENGTH=630 /DNA_ID=CAMNT_0043210395 /DNA_START=23 /DNA_END=1915 /DNA_ORIENTATION=-